MRGLANLTNGQTKECTTTRPSREEANEPEQGESVMGLRGCKGGEMVNIDLSELKLEEDCCSLRNTLSFKKNGGAH